MARFLTLLSDFGLRDAYVGAMKGAIAMINPDLHVIDLTHDLPPHNIAAASYNLRSTYAYFPSGTVHVAVVDPGVGSDRRGVAIAFYNQAIEGFLVGPDNGIFTGILAETEIIVAVELTNHNYWRSPQLSDISNTFHGRDIFAPVGAHLASGLSIGSLGKEVDPTSLVRLELPELVQSEDKIIGCVQHIDRFGNLITNIPARLVAGQNWSISLGGQEIKGATTYSSAKHGELVALVSSNGWIELAVNRGDAKSLLRLDYGDLILLMIEP
jgi:S-adenosylmethionine hydrolase